MASKKYDFKKPLLDVDDTPLVENGKEVIMATSLSNHIRNAVIGKEIVIKFFSWAKDLSKVGVLVLDEDDRQKLRDNILDSMLPSLLKGRLVEVLDDQGEPIIEAKK